MQEKYRPIVFGISPSPPDEYRFSELINSESLDYRSKSGLGMYDYGRRQSINQAVESFVEKNNEYPGPLVIVVNTHGSADSGNFSDGEKIINPQCLWRELKAPVQGYLARRDGRKVYLVMAQCYGAIFASRLSAILNSERDPGTVGTIVVGLSHDETFSEWIVDSDDAVTVSNEARHVNFAAWMKMFENAEDSAAAGEQGDGMGARLQLAANYPPPEL